MVKLHLRNTDSLIILNQAMDSLVTGNQTMVNLAMVNLKCHLIKWEDTILTVNLNLAILNNLAIPSSLVTLNLVIPNSLVILSNQVRWVNRFSQSQRIWE